MELEKLKKEIREGQFGAITLDTSIFDKQSLRLNSGLLKQLEQFHNSSIRLIISEVVKEEILSHLTQKTKEVQDKIKKSLKEAENYWCVEKHHLESIEKLIFDGRETQEIVLKRFRQFVEITSLEIVESQDCVMISDLLQMYFEGKPPFQKTGKKKSEFPDAIALISLEMWADDNETKIIVVTSDNDWKSFCENHETLIAIGDLGDALTLFQLQNADDICKHLSEKYEKGELDQVKEAISDALDDLSNCDFSVEAYSYFRYEHDSIEIMVNGFEFKLLERPNVIFKPVNFDNDVLVVESKLSIDVDAECSFLFSVYDSVDKDDFVIGSSTNNIQTNLDANILISFVGDLNRIGGEIEVHEVEMETKTPYVINFDDIGPDWINEDEDYE